MSQGIIRNQGEASNGEQNTSHGIDKQSDDLHEAISEGRRTEKISSNSQVDETEAEEPEKIRVILPDEKRI